MKVIAGLALLISGMAMASDPPTYKDEFGSLNCRGWNQLNDDQAVVYLAGLDQGMGTLAFDVAAARERYVSYFPGGATYGEMRKGVNEICAQPENANIPVIFAARAFGLKAHGSKPQDIEEYLRGLRAAPNGK